MYNVTWATNIPLLRRLQTGADGVKVLILNGDTDPSISSFKTQRYTSELDFPVLDAWRPWTFGAAGPEVVAGQVIQWAGNITEITVRGSGHMVPGFKPYSALLMMQNFLSDAGVSAWPALPPSAPAQRPAHALPGERY